MSNIHPNWNTTSNSGPTKITVENEAHQNKTTKTEKKTVHPVAGITVSRKPAAIVGIAVVLCSAIGLFQSSSLTGQVSDDEIVIRITEEGFKPEQVLASPGQVLRFINYDAIPHRVRGKRICDGDDDDVCLDIESLFPGASATFTVPEELKEDTYNIKSRTKDEFKSILVVQEVTQAEDPIYKRPSQTIADFLSEYGAELEKNNNLPIPEVPKMAADELESNTTTSTEPSNENLIPTNDFIDKGPNITNPVKEVQELHRKLKWRWLTCLSKSARISPSGDRRRCLDATNYGYNWWNYRIKKIYP